MQIKETETSKVVFSEKYKYIFNKLNGDFVRWGRIAEENPIMAPGPEILDLEISTGKCKKGCDFCLRKDTNIQLPEGKMKLIQDIKKGDKVISYDLQKQKEVVNEVIETYEREYEGILIHLELNNGEIVSITPEHEVFIKGKGFIEASKIVEGDDIINIK